MPHVDRGSIAIDVSRVEGLGGEDRKRLLDEAVESNAILVTKPSIVTVWLSSKPLRIALGVGSLLFPPGAQPSLEVGGFEVAAPEWIDGCKLTRATVMLRVSWAQGEPAASGKILPAELENPIALSVAGVHAEVTECEGRVIPLATVDGYPAVGYGRDGILVAVIGGEARWRLEYILSALQYCSDRKMMKLP